ncbi:GtrA family protein [Vibrio cholerae]|uniref:GtrA family protein n=1 Tax=Vibrio cholerae TaxID=666 RepID=UPI00115ACC1C|nr:GtrA family protein [Vibrio cholerae]
MLVDAIKKKIIQYNKFIIYILVGLVSSFIDTYSLYFFSSVNLSIDLSVSLAFILGLLSNYLMHSMITFKSGVAKNSFVKYLVVVAFNYLLTLILIKIMIDLLDIGLIMSKIITLPIISVVGFISSKLWIYK